MTIYIDEEFDADTLEDLRAQALAAADRAWRQAVEDEALWFYRQEAEKAGLLPRPAVNGLFDLVSVSSTDLWGKALAAEVAKGTALGKAIGRQLYWP